jgi:hypothetical protein
MQAFKNARSSQDQPKTDPKEKHLRMLDRSSRHAGKKSRRKLLLFSMAQNGCKRKV